MPFVIIQNRRWDVSGSGCRRRPIHPRLNVEESKVSVFAHAGHVCIWMDRKVESLGFGNPLINEGIRSSALGPM